MPRRAIIWAAVFAALIATRWTFAPKYLFYIDNVNFALAIEHFQPLLHQPQPPGDPLFVLLLKTLHLFIRNIKHVQLLAGALGSCLTLFLVHKLGNEIFGPRAGAFAVAILFFLPAFWLAGIADQVRVFIATGSCAVAICAWRAIAFPNRASWLFATAAALGIAAGFRPELLILLFPLLCLAWFKGMQRFPHAIAALAVLSVFTALWLVPMIARTGLQPFLHLFLFQWTVASAHTSVFGGAALHEGLQTALLATYWTGVGSLCWIGALAVVAKRTALNFRDRRVLFFAVWFLPPFLFHAIVFIHDPDTALDCIPALAIIGGAVLSQATQGQSRNARRFVAASAIAVNVTIFFLSPLHLGKDASYAWVHLVGQETENTLDALATAPSSLVILNRALITPRQIAYYFPRATIVSLDQDTRAACRVQLPPGPEHILWVPRFDAHPRIAAPFHTEHGIFAADLPIHTHFRVDNCEFQN